MRKLLAYRLSHGTEYFSPYITKNQGLVARLTVSLQSGMYFTGSNTTFVSHTGGGLPLSHFLLMLMTNTETKMAVMMMNRLKQ